MKDAAPMIRLDMILPAIHTSWKFPFSAEYSDSICAAVAFTGYNGAG